MLQVNKNVVANFIGKGWAALMSFLFIPFYIKLMGIEAYGLVGVYIALSAVFSLFDLGLGTTLNREFARLSTDKRNEQYMLNLLKTLETLYWCLAFIAGITVILLSSLIANHWINSGSLDVNIIATSIILMGFVIALQLPFSLYSGGLLGLQRQVILNYIIIFIATIRAVGSVLVLWFVEPTILAFLSWHVIVSVLQVGITVVLLKRGMVQTGSRPQFRKEILFDIWKFAAGMTGISVVTVLLTQADKVILSKVLTLEMLGYYSVAWMVASGLYYIVSPIFLAFFPQFSQLAKIDDKNRLGHLYHQGSQLMSVAVIPVAVIIAVFAKEILTTWTGDPVLTENTHLLLTLLVTGSAIHGLINLPYAIQLAHGWTSLAFYINLIAVIILVPFVYYMANIYGAIGGAIVWVILNTGYLLIGVQIMHTKLLIGEKLKWYLVDIGFPLIGVLLVVFPASYFIKSFQFSSLEIISLVLLTAILAQLSSMIFSPHVRKKLISAYHSF